MLHGGQFPPEGDGLTAIEETTRSDPWNCSPEANPQWSDRGNTMKIRIAVAIISLALSACATQPLGPTVTVMPAPGKPFPAFAEDDAVCKSFASTQVAGAPDQANAGVIGSAVVGTLLGAGLGAAVGGGQGAGIGAASGALLGTGVGAKGSAWSQMSIQQRYNIAYMQCMYSKGNQVPGYSIAAAPPY